MYRLIVSDVDGTLVKEGTSDLNPLLFDCILKLKNRGIRFVAASGRQYESVRHAFEPIKDEIMFIADNGAFVYEKDSMLVGRTFEPEDYCRLIRYLKSIPDIYIMVSSLEGSFTDCSDDSFLTRMSEGYGLKMTRTHDLEMTDIHVSKIGVYCNVRSPKDQAADSVKHCGSFADIIVSGERWVDYLPLNVSKGDALSWIQQHLGIPAEQTVAFGDQNNDISMFAFAGDSYAVPDAAADAKRAAKYILDEGPDKDGVLHYLEKLLN